MTLKNKETNAQRKTKILGTNFTQYMILCFLEEELNSSKILTYNIRLIIFRERLDGLEKEIRIRSLQRSPGGHSHSHDSAIDSDMYEWETDHVDLDMVGISAIMLS